MAHPATTTVTKRSGSEARAGATEESAGRTTAAKPASWSRAWRKLMAGIRSGQHHPAPPKSKTRSRRRKSICTYGGQSRKVTVQPVLAGLGVSCPGARDDAPGSLMFSEAFGVELPYVDLHEGATALVDLVRGTQAWFVKLFRHRWHSRPRQWRDHAGACAQGRAGRRPGVPERRPPPSRADRQGHAAVRLHDRDRAGRGLHLGRHGRAADRPDADAGRRHADALDARRSRRDDLGLAQSLRRQRHQAVRSGRLQAVRRDRAEDRGADRRRSRQAAGEVAPISAAPSASTACRTATSNSPSARCRAICRSKACAS